MDAAMQRPRLFGGGVGGGCNRLAPLAHRALSRPPLLWADLAREQARSVGAPRASVGLTFRIKNHPRLTSLAAQRPKLLRAHRADEDGEEQLERLLAQHRSGLRNRKLELWVVLWLELWFRHVLAACPV